MNIAWVRPRAGFPWGVDSGVGLAFTVIDLDGGGFVAGEPFLEMDPGLAARLRRGAGAGDLARHGDGAPWRQGRAGAGQRGGRLRL